MNPTKQLWIKTLRWTIWWTPWTDLSRRQLCHPWTRGACAQQGPACQPWRCRAWHHWYVAVGRSWQYFCGVSDSSACIFLSHFICSCSEVFSIILKKSLFFLVKEQLMTPPKWHGQYFLDQWKTPWTTLFSGRVYKPPMGKARPFVYHFLDAYLKCI